MKLNLGANDRKMSGFLSVDIVPPADIICDLNGPWPWEDSSVDEVLAYSVFEHIGDCTHISEAWTCKECYATRYALFNALPGMTIFPEGKRHPLAKPHVMNELWRVLVPGGKATLQLPVASEGDGGFCDPTHQSFWTTSDFEYYTAGDPHRERFGRYYGIEARFKVTNLVAGKIPTMKYQRRYGGHVVEMQVVLEAVKP